ncbi:MAG: redox-regulated ATPase YchF [Oscillospiraceae bacterium]|nr:redox-regulated ATPase YchF [Oscillospiraceae bacterium]
MKLGIVGLPNIGKTTIFNALTSAGVDIVNSPFSTRNPNIGVVNVPDKRLDELEKMYKPKKKTFAKIEFYDIAGLAKGASKGEGLGNKFLSSIREAQAIIHVVRCFDDDNVIHLEGSVDPTRDVENLNLELIFSDLEILERRMERTLKLVHSGDKNAKTERDLQVTIKSHLESGKPIRNLEVTDEEKKIVDSYSLITSKPIIYVANISEEALIEGEEDDYVKALKEYAEEEQSQVVVISGKIEEEISQLSMDEKMEILSEYGLSEPGLNKLITASYDLLGLISFLTSGKDEVRAWTITKGTKAQQAAGKIHSDIERGFIRAEVIPYDKLMEVKSESIAKEKGYYRLEGKEYVVQDGDIIHFRFNV